MQEWYASQCNSEWEHRHGISITSCDNPGWWVKIDLAGTSLETKSFDPVARNVDPEQMARIAGGLETARGDRGGDWMLCQAKNKMSEGAGDPEKLQAILETFLNWATPE